MSELYIYQNARCNNKNYRGVFALDSSAYWARYFEDTKFINTDY